MQSRPAGGPAPLLEIVRDICIIKGVPAKDTRARPNTEHLQWIKGSDAENVLVALVAGVYQPSSRYRGSECWLTGGFG